MASRENHPKEVSPELLLEAYRRGIFPMGMAGRLEWFSPDPRGVLPMDAFHLPHGLRKALRTKPWEIRVNTVFEEVMRHCAQRSDTWIDETILRSYLKLHNVGRAHSIEAWLNGKLAGGLYGVHLGAAFFGESMFHHVTDGSKVALHALMTILKVGNFKLLDIQWTTPHLEQFGAKEIPRRDYLIQLKSALNKNGTFPPSGVWIPKKPE